MPQFFVFHQAQVLKGGTAVVPFDPSFGARVDLAAVIGGHVAVLQSQPEDLALSDQPYPLSLNKYDEFCKNEDMRFAEAESS